jgi:hypothetical protein
MELSREHASMKQTFVQIPIQLRVVTSQIVWKRLASPEWNV